MKVRYPSTTQEINSLFFLLYIHNTKPNVSVNTNNTITGDDILRVENISLVWQNTLKVISNCSLSMNANDIISIYGNTGIGKTSIAKVLSGQVRPTSGEVKIFGEVYQYTHKTKLAFQRSVIQLIPQIASSSFHPLWTIKKSLDDSYHMFFKKVKLLLKQDEIFLLELKGLALWNNSRTEHENIRNLFEECIRSLCKTMEISEDILTRGVFEISGGQLQRCALMRALLVFPSILILDEPVNQLDIELRKITLDLISSFVEHSNIAVLLISHLLEVHKYFSHHSQYRAYEIDNLSLKELNNFDIN